MMVSYEFRSSSTAIETNLIYSTKLEVAPGEETSGEIVKFFTIKQPKMSRNKANGRLSAENAT